MSRLDLSKSQKKIARKIIGMGLQREYVHGLEKVDKAISEWKSGKYPNRDAYLNMFDIVQKHDKIISRRYDFMTGSKYVYIIASQLADGIISREELSEFDEDVQQSIIFLSGIEEK